LTGRVWTGRTAGHAASGLTGLRVWTTEEGYALSSRLPDGRLAVLASTSDSPDASGVPAGARPVAADTADLARLVPPGYALLVDGAAPNRRTVAADVVDGLRVAEPPDGTEPDLKIGPVPPHAAPVAADAQGAALATGAKHATAVWAQTASRRGLWISLDRAPEQAHQAALDAIARHAPAEPARVLDYRNLPHRAQYALFVALGTQHQPGETRPFTGRQNAVVVVVCFVGAILIVAGQGRPGSTGTALQVIGWGMQVLLVLGVIVVASGRGFAVPGLPRPGSGEQVRPLPLLGFLTVSGLLLWQAVRGLS
jgi:hypothetical protein